MFLFSAQLMQQELEKHEPSIYPACQQAIAHGKVD
jgi:mannose-1-phosphate guanylyltransferase